VNDNPRSPDVVAEPTVEEVVQEMRVASLEDIKSLPEMRKAHAVPFDIPDTPFRVMIAPCTAVAQYGAIVSQLKLLRTEDDDERKTQIQAAGNALVKNCVVEPVLDDEALEAINNYNGYALTALLQKCREVSKLGEEGETDVVEAFS